MKRIITIVSFVVLLTTSLHVSAKKPRGSAYLEGEGSTHALILCHGRGKYPKWEVVNPLRKKVNKKMGWHTLSLQMPADDKNWKEYANDFPEAFDRIKKGITFLRDEKNVTTIYLMGHSMGSRMAAAFMAENPVQPINGLIVAGIRNNGGPPLDGKNSLMRVKVPVLDIWGSDSSKDVNHAADREPLVSEIYKQVSVSSADHRFKGNTKGFLSAVISWLESHQ